MNNIITNKFWEIMGSTSTSLSRDSTSSSDSPSSIPIPQETRFLFRQRLTSYADSPVVERRCMSSSTPPMAQTPTSIPVPTHSSLNRLVDTVFIDESPRRQQRTGGSWSNRDSVCQPGKALSFDHFQFNLYQTDSEPCCSEASAHSSEEYSSTGTKSVQGQLNLQINYNLEKVQLEVVVIAANRLKISRPITKGMKSITRHSSLKWVSKRQQPECNPYVRLKLLPGQGESVTTTVKRKTQSPVWNEKFVFPMSYQQSQKTNLEFVVRDCVKDVDQLVLGKVFVSLNDPELNLAAGELIGRDIISCDSESDDVGEIFVSLQYLPSAGRLTVDVIKARNLIQPDFSKEPDTIVKVNFLCDKKVVKSKRTEVQKASIHPVYNESFRLNVTEDALQQTGCVISVFDYRAAGKDELLGRITLGNGSGVDKAGHWEDMVRNPRSPIANWHQIHTARHSRECRLSDSSGENGRSTVSINNND